jgi:hypothetical protein
MNITKIDILFDRLLYPIILTALIFIPDFVRNGFTEWDSLLINSGIFILILSGISLMISTNYMTKFEIRNENLTFEYKINFSNSILGKQIPLNSISSYKFDSGFNKKQFHDVTIEFEKENGSFTKFEIKINNDDIWIELLSVLKKTKHNNVYNS